MLKIELYAYNFKDKMSLLPELHKGLYSSRSQSAADTISHPSLLISDDEEAPQLTPQKKAPDMNGNTSMRNNNSQEVEQMRAPSMDSEIKDLLSGVATRLMPDAVGHVAVKSTSKSKAMEFQAKLMGLPMPDMTSQHKAWKEHPLIQLGREEVNTKFSEMPFGPDSEKRLGCPPPSQAAKVQTTAAAETLCGADMTKLPHSLRAEIPAGAKIETVELKSKLPRVVEEETNQMLWNVVRKFIIKFSNLVVASKTYKIFCYSEIFTLVTFPFALVAKLGISALYGIIHGAKINFPLAESACTLIGMN